MCSIIGLEKRQSAALTAECFAKTKSRGPDMTRYTDAGEGMLGFHRLAIMDESEKGMQPFSLGRSKVVCNGEVYGFRALRESLLGEYEFLTDSDCEVLLPLYAKYGTDMFAMLDAEFALVIYDGERDALVAARDPIGIRPLYWGEGPDGTKVFASEPKSLVGLASGISPFPPGCWWSRGRLVRYRDPAAFDVPAPEDEDAVCAGIRERLVAAVEKRLDADAPLGFLLSGGLDSSLVCSIAAKKQRIRTFAIGMEGDAIDLKYARRTAEYIGSEHHEVIMTEQEVLGALDEVVAVLGTWDITTIRASMGMYLLCRAIHRDTDVRVLLTGEVSDELFGYKYTDFAPSPEAFQEESEKRVRELHMYDVLRADRCISANSMEARVPFGDLEFESYVMSIPPRLKTNIHGKGKYLLRRAFEGDWLPEDILWRDKAAFSDAVGHSMTDGIKAFAQTLYTDGQMRELCAKYEYRPPFTKESLLYRELFEKHYPGMADMVKDYWMPNREWKGCDVNDPSARVLSNYGKSGV